MEPTEWTGLQAAGLICHKKSFVIIFCSFLYINILIDINILINLFNCEETLTVLPIPFPETTIDSPLFAKDSLDIVILATLASVKSLVSTEFADL